MGFADPAARQFQQPGGVDARAEGAAIGQHEFGQQGVGPAWPAAHRQPPEGQRRVGAGLVGRGRSRARRACAGRTQGRQSGAIGQQSLDLSGTRRQGAGARAQHGAGGLRLQHRGGQLGGDLVEVGVRRLDHPAGIGAQIPLDHQVQQGRTGERERGGRQHGGHASRCAGGRCQRWE
ncbi:MAG: hypothetical protein KA169_07495 [Burkholderiaceae bacterium]|nr:hypothetical protein [Burkholderiaceae bacterium]